MSVADIETKLPQLLEEAGHSEIWSISLEKDSPQRKVVLHKYLTAHKGDASAAADGILATLKWRKEFNPRVQVGAAHDSAKFGGLGYVTELDPDSVPVQDIVRPGGGNRKAVVTWNVYGAVKDHEKTFGDVDEFLRWRVGLMERGVQALRLNDPATDAPTEDIAIVQVHDYLNVSFLRPNPATRAATKKTIEVLAAHYPELLSRKYFVNVPVVMGFMFNLIKPFVAKETVAKFQVLSWGSAVASIPEAYGGEAPALDAQSTDAASPTIAGEAKSLDEADREEPAASKEQSA